MLQRSYRPAQSSDDNDGFDQHFRTFLALMAKVTEPSI